MVQLKVFSKSATGALRGFSKPREVFLEVLWHGKKMKNALVKEIRVKSVLQLIRVDYVGQWLHVCEVSYRVVATGI